MQPALDEYFEQRGPAEDVPDFDGAYAEAFGKPTSNRAKRVLTDDKARALADTPILTGDPEYDALELEETRADREPINA